MATEKLKRFPLLSFYSGGGFMDMGFESAGFEIVWTNEVDKDFARLHEAGITSWRSTRGSNTRAEIFNRNSIVDVNCEAILNEAFPGGKPDNFGMIGGPPCQDFTMNGNRTGFQGERGRLTIVYFDRILELLPTFFVMENVTGLVKMKSSREYLKGLLAKVEKLYHIDYEILNALDFGVPQFRERVFFVGIRKDKLHLPVAQDSLGNWFKFPVDQQYFGSAKKYDWPTISKFGSKISRPRNLPRQLCVESCLVSDSNLKKIANASEYFNLYVDEKFLKRIDEGETVRPSFKRLHRFRYSPTACYGNNEVHLHPYKNRRISVREALRIQGVAESYVLPGDLPLTKKFKMIGNGVPVPLAEAVAKALREYLLDHRVVSE